MSPFLASFLSSLMRGLTAVAMMLSVLSRSDQPPQPPIVTFTCLLAMKNEPSFILATAMMFCVVARRMRVLASATPLAGEKWKVATPAFGLPSAEHQHVGDMRLLGHRAFDRDRHRHGVAVLGDLGKVELHLAFGGLLAAGEGLDQVLRIVRRVRGRIEIRAPSRARQRRPQDLAAIKSNHCRALLHQHSQSECHAPVAPNSSARFHAKDTLPCRDLCGKHSFRNRVVSPHHVVVIFQLSRRWRPTMQQITSRGPMRRNGASAKK